MTDKDVEPVTWILAQAGRAVNVIAYSRAIATMHQVGLAMAKFQQKYDVILSPTLAKPPVALGVLSLSPASIAAVHKRHHRVWSVHRDLQRDGSAFDVSAVALVGGRFADRGDVLGKIRR